MPRRTRSNPLDPILREFIEALAIADFQRDLKKLTLAPSPQVTLSDHSAEAKENCNEKTRGGRPHNP